MRRGSLCIIAAAVLAAQIGSTPTPTHAANLTITAGGRVSIELLYSNSDFSNTLSVMTPHVGVAISGCQLHPATGLTGIHVLSEKLSQRGCRVELDADPTTPAIDGFAANMPFEFGFCAQTDSDDTCEFVWSSDPAHNADGFDHVRVTPLSMGGAAGQAYQLSWEDLPGGGDQDFNDLVAIVRVQADSDHDGLWDDWEQVGIDTTGDGVPDLDLPALGANPNRQDIFVEIDYMDCAVAGSDCAGATYSHRPKPAAIQAVIDAFAQAPISNPNGSIGIALHVDVNNAIPQQQFVALGCDHSDDAGFDAIKSNPAFFGTQNPRRFAYHYALFGHRQGPNTTSSGCAEQPGNDLIVTLGEWNTICVASGLDGVLNTPAAGDDIAIAGDTQMIVTGPNLRCDTARQGNDMQIVGIGNSPTADLDNDGLDDRTVGTVTQQAVTFMHELGHNLNLDHGGGDADNHKPNYQSVMNYSFANGIPTTNLAGPSSWKLDFSRQGLASLFELSLNELTGIAAGNNADDTYFYCPNSHATLQVLGIGPIDWSCDGDGGTDTNVTVDLNNDDDLATLTGFDDWANLKFDFQNARNFEDGVHSSTTDIIELDYPTYAEQPGVIDLVVQQTTLSDIVLAGQQVQLVFDVSNIGPVPASEITVLNTLPSGLTVDHISPAESCTHQSHVLTCTVAALSTGDHALITVTANTDPIMLDGTTIQNTVVVSRAINEANLSNNVVTTTLNVVRQSGLAITQTRQPEAVFAGDMVTYQVQIQNRGQSIATGVIATGTLPVGVSLDATASSAGCAARGVVLTCTVGTLLDASSKTLTLVGKVSAAMPPGTPLTNTISVRATGRDPDLSDNVAVNVGLLYGRIYLPIITHQRAVVTASHEVDLIVKAMTVTAQTVEVVIQNIGSGTLNANDQFWVDLYISPTVEPTGVNQTWQNTFSTGGLVWAITGAATTLGPQQTLTLTVGDLGFSPAESLIPINMPAGTRIYVQVDSANTLTSYGGVRETHELRGTPYNNIRSFTLAQPINTQVWPLGASTMAAQQIKIGPTRP